MESGYLFLRSLSTRLANFSRPLALLVVLNLLPMARAEDAAPSRAASEPQHGEVSSPRRTIITYQRYRQGFRSICELLMQDGRDEYFMARITPSIERDDSCRACRPLLRALAQGCKENLEKGKKGDKRSGKREPSSDAHDEGAEAAEEAPPADGEAVETPAPLVPLRQREPSPALLDLVSEVFSAMAAEEDTVSETYRAIQKLGALLLPPGVEPSSEEINATAFTPAARDYFSVFMTYVHHPFSGHAQLLEEQAVDRAGAAGSARGRSTESVDDLFDF